MNAAEVSFHDYMGKIRIDFEKQVTDKNQIWEVRIHLKLEKKIELTNGTGKGKQTVVKSEWITDQMITMALLTPTGEMVPGITNRQVIGRNIKDVLGDKYSFENIYKLEKLKFLGNSQTKE